MLEEVVVERMKALIALRSGTGAEAAVDDALRASMKDLSDWTEACCDRSGSSLARSFSSGGTLEYVIGLCLR